MAHAIILSKDRAAQAHLCIEALYKNHNGLFDNISVLYKYSNSDFSEGYRLLEKQFPKVTFLPESDYYNDIFYLLNGVAVTSFFTDDDIIYRKIPKNKYDIEIILEEMDDVGCISLRLGKNTYIQDPYISSQTTFPKELLNVDEIYCWNWRECPSYTNFGYPLSVDGHLFRTEELRKILSAVKFNNPNQQEIAMMSQMNTFPAFMGCFETSVLINTPLNRVQDTCMNRAGEKCGQTAESMNLKYLQGRRLDYNSIDFSNIIGCHQELDIAWTTR